MVRRSSSILLFAACIGSAQSFERLLPHGAKVIETADVSTIAKKPRVLVLWMLSPSKHTRVAKEGCANAVYGDDWQGPTRLSLIDPSMRALINTLTIKIDEEWTAHEDSFMLPFFVSNDYYTVPNPNAEKEGLPQILDLRDYTGEGKSLQFPLFAYEACTVADTGLFGYSLILDKALQYPIAAKGHEKTSPMMWASQVFAMKPVSPGHWKFTWGPGHGVMYLIDEEVVFDPANQRFIEKATKHRSK